jgi:glyoxylase-like metal-dependent hydrolase (beta-lactamase superfamily II)
VVFIQTYEIIPIKVGEFVAMEKSSLTYLIDPGKRIVSPIIMYLIKGRDRLILVDTGGSDEDWAAKYHSIMKRRPDEHPVHALKKLDINIEDIETVVNTHLHWDHCFNNSLFDKAMIYVQKKELQYAVCPFPAHYSFYESQQIGMSPPWIKNIQQICAVDGDFNLFPGIDLVTLPGHSPGFQGVLVNTEKGRYLIASDCLGTFENWEGRGYHRHIPSGIFCSLSDYYDTFKKIEIICDYILPGHDLKVFEHSKYPAK